MLAVYADAPHPDDPLAGVVVGEREEPDVPDGWSRVRVRAASLNRHDLWTLRGVGIKQEQLPMIVGCDAAGIDEDEALAWSYVHTAINAGWAAKDGDADEVTFCIALLKALDG